jgi:hypothetical protein
VPKVRRAGRHRIGRRAVKAQGVIAVNAHPAALKVQVIVVNARLAASKVLVTVVNAHPAASKALLVSVANAHLAASKVQAIAANAHPAASKAPVTAANVHPGAPKARVIAANAPRAVLATGPRAVTTANAVRSAVRARAQTDRRMLARAPNVRSAASVTHPIAPVSATTVALRKSAATATGATGDRVATARRVASKASAAHPDAASPAP